MSGFARHTTSGRAFAQFTGFEGDLLRSLAAQMIELLHDEIAPPSGEVDPLEAMLDFSGPTTLPEDPVLARLFPDAYGNDPEAAGEFRRFTESALRTAKSASAERVIDTLEEAGLPIEYDSDDVMIDVELERPEAITWLRTFTDIRLALATRLGVEEGQEDYWQNLDDEDPRAAAYDIYEWVGYLQETLVESLG